MPLITEQQIETLRSALEFVSPQLADRQQQQLVSECLPDVSEAIATCLRLLAGADSQSFAGAEARRASFNLFDPFGRFDRDAAAEAGFYYDADNNEARCFFCDLRLRDWRTDAVISAHGQLSPFCCFHSVSKRPVPAAASGSQEAAARLQMVRQQYFGHVGRVVCGLGFPDTKVLLCIARKAFLRGQRFASSRQMLPLLQAEMDRELGLLPDPPLFESQFELADVFEATLGAVTGLEEVPLPPLLLP